MFLFGSDDDGGAECAGKRRQQYEVQRVIARRRSPRGSWKNPTSFSRSSPPLIRIACLRQMRWLCLSGFGKIFCTGCSLPRVEKHQTPLEFLMIFGCFFSVLKPFKIHDNPRLVGELFDSLSLGLAGDLSASSVQDEKVEVLHHQGWVVDGFGSRAGNRKRWSSYSSGWSSKIPEHCFGKSNCMVCVRWLIWIDRFQRKQSPTFAKMNASRRCFEISRSSIAWTSPLVLRWKISLGAGLFHPGYLQVRLPRV